MHSACAACSKVIPLVGVVRKWGREQPSRLVRTRQSLRSEHFIAAQSLTSHHIASHHITTQSITPRSIAQSISKQSIILETIAEHHRASQNRELHFRANCTAGSHFHIPYLPRSTTEIWNVSVLGIP